MTRFLIFFSSLLLLAASAVGERIHEVALTYVIGASPIWTISRAVVALILLTYGFSAYFRRLLSDRLLLIVGLGLLYFGWSSLLFGSRAAGLYMPAIDIGLALLTGTVTVLASLELPSEPKSRLNITSLKLSALYFAYKASDRLTKTTARLVEAVHRISPAAKAS